MSRDPYLFIVAGPTGSGKSSLPGKIKKYLGIKDDNNINKILIDDIVEKQQSYKTFVKNLIKKECPESLDTICSNLKQKLENPDEEILKEFSDAYNIARNDICCNCNASTCEPCISCNAINDNKLINALNNGNDIVYETTGTYYPSWLFTWSPVANPLKEKNYKVIMAWTVANWCNLISRNKSRAVDDMENFLITGKSTPRLPDITQKTYKKNVELIQDVFYRIISNCGDTYKKNFCKYPVRFMVIDNRKKNIANPVIYDSQFAKAHDITTLQNMDKKKLLYKKAFELRKIFNTPDTCGFNVKTNPRLIGGRKRKTKHKRRRRRRRKCIKKTRKYKKN